jgi:hypothetical protein
MNGGWTVPSYPAPLIDMRAFQEHFQVPQLAGFASPVSSETKCSEQRLLRLGQALPNSGRPKRTSSFLSASEDFSPAESHRVRAQPQWNKSIPRLSKAGMPSRSEGWGGLFKGESTD